MKQTSLADIFFFQQLTRQTSYVPIKWYFNRGKHKSFVLAFQMDRSVQLIEFRISINLLSYVILQGFFRSDVLWNLTTQSHCLIRLNGLHEKRIQKKTLPWNPCSTILYIISKWKWMWTVMRKKFNSNTHRSPQNESLSIELIPSKFHGLVMCTCTHLPAVVFFGCPHSFWYELIEWLSNCIGICWQQLVENCHECS